MPLLQHYMTQSYVRHNSPRPSVKFRPGCLNTGFDIFDLCFCFKVPVWVLESRFWVLNSEPPKRGRKTGAARKLSWHFLTIFDVFCPGPFPPAPFAIRWSTAGLGSTGVWCIPGFGAGFESLSNLQNSKKGKAWKAHFYFLRQALVCNKPGAIEIWQQN